MRGTEFLEKLNCVDPAFLEEAENFTPQKKTGKSRFLKWGAIAACFLALLAIAPIVAEAKEYNNAVKFLVDNGIPSEGMSRAEIKTAYQNLKKEQNNQTAAPQPATQTDIFAAQIGDTVLFGSYEQDGTTENGAEAIEWYVLDRRGENILLLSKYILDVIPYDKNDGFHADTNQYSLDWESCSLRTWLNHDFYEASFDNKEKSYIALSALENPDNPNYPTAGGNPTKDYVFLLSLEEAKQYFSLKPAGNDAGLASCWWDYAQDARIRATATRQAYNNGLLLSFGTPAADNSKSEYPSEAACCWWLRSPGSFALSRLYVSYGGNIDTAGIILTNEYGIRPAVWLNLSDNPNTPLPTATPVLPSPTIIPASPDHPELANVQAGNIVSFGSYEQDGNSENGAEAIEWYVLDRQGSRILLLSKNILDYGQYSEGYMFVPWENCTLRQWLNKKFYHAAFNDTEKKYIELSSLENPDHPVFQSPGGNPTEDRVFLLSLQELEKYFSFRKTPDNFLVYDGDIRLRAVGTKQAYQNGLPIFDEETNQTYTFLDAHEYVPDATGTWWLRSPGLQTEATIRDHATCAAQVYYNGCTASNMVYTNAGIRPAIWINLDTEKNILPTPTPVITEKKVVNILDKTTWSNIMTDTALEVFYSDAQYKYYFGSIKSQYVVVQYSDETEESVKTALANGVITISDLDRYGIWYEKQEKEQ